jgi:hypothetical protein
MRRHTAQSIMPGGISSRFPRPKERRDEVKTPEEIARSIWKVDSDLQDQIAAAIQAERDHWTSESNLPRVEEVQGAFREAKLLERIADLEKGLEPFAEIYETYDSNCADAGGCAKDETVVTWGSIPVRPFHRAAELLKTKG